MEVREIPRQMHEELDLTKENPHFNLVFKPWQDMARDTFGTLFFLYLEIRNQAFPLLFPAVILVLSKSRFIICVSSPLNSSGHNITEFTTLMEGILSKLVPCCSVSEMGIKTLPVHKILNSGKERKLKTACLAPIWV